MAGRGEAALSRENRGQNEERPRADLGLAGVNWTVLCSVVFQKAPPAVELIASKVLEITRSVLNQWSRSGQKENLETLARGIVGAMVKANGQS